MLLKISPFDEKKIWIHGLYRPPLFCNKSTMLLFLQLKNMTYTVEELSNLVHQFKIQKKSRDREVNSIFRDQMTENNDTIMNKQFKPTSDVRLFVV